ncbi:MAG TPA: pentapeptide repeat-containing protein [Oligoflexus sp.]|uniref:pentapeptide repeat-containing protein n=1 Tax=Oligoflexus sp. TaxID=1971216 RepID=UPI002D636E06|nr:pentapeptide repeat-containing protein [Oligoflexus sp.]HYX35866.1 pentapeptide repeat-containing protein [Oligoflexus sp.]
MQDNLPEHPSELWEKNPVVAAAMLGALRENPQTRDLQENQRIMLVERALRDQCRGDHAWLSVMVPRLQAGENILLETPAGADAAAASPAKPGDKKPEKAHPEITVSQPAVVTSQEELDDLLEMHRHWIKQVLEPGLDLGPGRANLKGSDLRAFNLDGADLRAARLEHCNLSGVSLMGANLAGANLAGANLEGACLERARLRRANLAGANLTRARLCKADLRHIQWKGVTTEATDFTDAIGAPDASPATTLEA